MATLQLSSMMHGLNIRHTTIIITLQLAVCNEELVTLIVEEMIAKYGETYNYNYAS
jgi:hypothetical protein